MTDTPEHQAWRNMLERCFNPNVPLYHQWGGRGITVFPEWATSFKAFFRDVGPRPGPGYSLDRIENNKNYEPGNVRWTDRGTQQRNTRRNVLLSHHGETLTISEWSRRTGLPWKTIANRIEAGLPSGDILSPERRPRSGPRKLSESQAREAIDRLAAGESSSKIAVSYDVTYGCIQKLHRGESWRHLPRPKPKPDWDAATRVMN